MKCIYHKDKAKTYRVQQRGKLFYVQEYQVGVKPTPEIDPWEDVSPPQDSAQIAEAMMYERLPAQK